MKSITKRGLAIKPLIFAGLISLVTAAGVSMMLAPETKHTVKPVERYLKPNFASDEQPRVTQGSNKQLQVLADLSNEMAALSNEVKYLRKEIELLKKGESENNELDELEDKISRSSPEEWNSFVTQQVQATFTEHWDIEDADPDWSQDRETEIDDYFSLHDFDGIELHHAECKESLCKLELSVEDLSANVEQGVTLREILASRDTFGTAAQYITREDGRKVVYLARRGHELPDVDIKELAKTFNP